MAVVSDNRTGQKNVVFRSLAETAGSEEKPVFSRVFLRSERIKKRGLAPLMIPLL